jgi:mannose-6-phosphate isomerase
MVRPIYPSPVPPDSALVSQQFQSFDETNALACHDHLKLLFTTLMEATDDHITQHLSQLIHRLSLSSSTSPHPSPHEDNSSDSDSGSHELNSLMQRLYSDYPNDRGVICPLLLNHLQIQPGEAFFMGPNEPHAYISGDCVECMALSDNTVRAGLTPKHRDVATLSKMLHYR